MSLTLPQHDQSYQLELIVNLQAYEGAHDCHQAETRHGMWRPMGSQPASFLFPDTDVPVSVRKLLVDLPPQSVPEIGRLDAIRVNLLCAVWLNDRCETSGNLENIMALFLPARFE